MGKIGAYLRSFRLIRMPHALITDWDRICGTVSVRRGSLHLKAFVSTYSPAVVPILEHIRANRDSDADRFLVLSLPEGPNIQTYMQCLFPDNDEQVLCEVDSGYFAYAPGKQEEVQLRTEVWLALQELGFPLDPGEGNFQTMIDLMDGRTLEDIAVTLLKALYLVCGARLGDTITWHAPLIENPDILPAACALLDPAQD